MPDTQIDVERRVSGCTAVGLLLLVPAALLLVVVGILVSRSMAGGDWGETVFRMERIHAAILDHHTRYGEYPRQLSEVSGRLGAISLVDPYTGVEFRYTLTDSGFVLQCLGRDGVPGGDSIPDRDILFDESGRR